MPSLLEIAHALVSDGLTSGSVAIDATLGNGHDAVFLAQCVGESGRIFGFDIQQQAITATTQRLLKQGLEQRASLFQASHADMVSIIPLEYQQKINAVMFNLGYLPGGDKSLITRADSTLLAINAACAVLADAGVITVLAYPGHPGGEQETRHIQSRCVEIAAEPGFATEFIHSEHQQAQAPQLFVIRKLTHLL